MNNRATYGRWGGTGPNTGKTAATFTCTAPDGTPLRRRFFGTAQAPLPEGETVVAALIPPSNGHGWDLWAVADTRESLPDYVHAAWQREAENRPHRGPAPVTVTATRA